MHGKHQRIFRDLFAGKVQIGLAGHGCQTEMQLALFEHRVALLSAQKQNLCLNFGMFLNPVFKNGDFPLIRPADDPQFDRQPVLTGKLPHFLFNLVEFIKLTGDPIVKKPSLIRQFDTVLSPF